MITKAGASCRCRLLRRRRAEDSTQDRAGALLSTLDEPDTLAELFLTSYDAVDGDLLEELWRHDQPETIEILDTLGAHLPDRKLAKAARRAALKHRSWMANRHR